MTLRRRKLIVLGIIAAVFLTANTLTLAGWLDEVGAIGLAVRFRSEFLTGTAITVIVTLLFLLISPDRVPVVGRLVIRHCPVSDHALDRQGRYCPECGSRV
ncbi:MAG: hypothetical protein JXA69_14345 [Phycisphaerae bacterium]|nr:hypothetical protein [Phycisphaerae bacterium]